MEEEEEEDETMDDKCELNGTFKRMEWLNKAAAVV